MVPNRMTDAREHHFDEEFIVAKLIKDDRSKSKIGSWLVHNECFCMDILDRRMIRHDVKKDGEMGKGERDSVFALRSGEQLLSSSSSSQGQDPAHFLIRYIVPYLIANLVHVHVFYEVVSNSD
jgi:hypothetical protein